MRHLHLHGLLLLPFVLLAPLIIRKIPQPIKDWYAAKPTWLQGFILIGGILILPLILLVPVLLFSTPPPHVPRPPSILTFRDGTCQITTPLGWLTQADIHPQASIQISTERRQAFAYVITERKNELDAATTLADYATARVQRVLKGIDKGTIVKGPEAEMLGGRKALLYEVQGTKTDGLPTILLTAYVEGSACFYQVVAFTYPANMDMYRPTLEGIISSFQEIDDEAAKRKP